MRPLLAYLRDQFWVLPALCTVAAVALALALSGLDESLDTSLTLPFLFSGGPEGARTVLSAIAGSMISFTGLVFSITIVVMQLTSSQFSPRVLRTFLRDRFNQFALGVFVATFTYALVVLRAVRGTAQVDPFVPQVSTTLASGLVLVSVAVFLGYIHHIAQSIRVAKIISRIGEDTRRLLERRHPADAEPVEPLPWPDGPGELVTAGRPGVVQQIEEQALQRIAQDRTLTIRVVPRVGDFVPTGGDLAMVHGGSPPVPELRRRIRLGDERNLDQDVGFGFRELVDIGERALSPGINDPTTTMQVIDQLHDLLRRLAIRALVPRQHGRDPDGRLAVLIPEPTFSDYLGLAIDELSHWARDDDRVQRRLVALLEDLLSVARLEHRPAIADALQRGRARTPQRRPSQDG